MPHCHCHTLAPDTCISQCLEASGVDGKAGVQSPPSGVDTWHLGPLFQRRDCDPSGGRRPPGHQFAPQSPGRKGPLGIRGCGPRGEVACEAGARACRSRISASPWARRTTQLSRALLCLGPGWTLTCLGTARVGRAMSWSWVNPARGCSPAISPGLGVWGPSGSGDGWEEVVVTKPNADATGPSWTLSPFLLSPPSPPQRPPGKHQRCSRITRFFRA